MNYGDMVKRMASLLQPVGDVVRGPWGLNKVPAERRGVLGEGGGGGVVQMPGAKRPPLFPGYEATKRVATDAEKFSLRAKAQSSWEGNPTLQKSYKTPEELYQMYLAAHGLK